MTTLYRQLAFALAVFLLASLPVEAADLQDVAVERVEGRYVLRSEVLFDTSRENLYRVLTDYDLYKRFTSAFTESKNLEPNEDGQPQFYNKMEGCILLFCITFERYGHLELEPMTEIKAIVDPERSDFEYSVERWEFVDKGEKTLLIYEFEMEPAFWVPPVIGPFYIRRALAAGAVDAVDRIEALAQGREPEV